MQNQLSSSHRRNRRRRARYLCRQPEAPPWIALLAPRTWPATVYDIAANGVALILSSPIAPGTKVKLELYNQSGRSWHARVGQVAHCTPQDLHTWRIGFDFLQPFTDVELQQLLPSHPAREQVRQNGDGLRPPWSSDVLGTDTDNPALVSGD